MKIPTKPLVLTPGINVIRLTKKATDIGKYYLGNVAIHIGKFHLISSCLNQKLIVEVKREEPILRLDKGAAALLSGLEQIMQLSLTVGSYTLPPDTLIKLVASRGLLIQHLPNEPLTSSLEINVQNTDLFSITQMPLRVLAELPSKDHQVTLVCPWASKPIPVILSFTPLLSTSWRLHTVQHRKFIQITVTGQTEQKLKLSLPQLDVRDKIKIISLNVTEPSSQIISNGLNVSFTWELLITPSIESPTLKAQFSVHYIAVPEEEAVVNDTTTKIHMYNFDLTDYQTLYVVEANVEPTKGNEFCRVGALCNLNLCIKRAGHTLDDSSIGSSLMYEVLAEQSVWAVCGRTAGVVTFETDLEPQSVVLDVMPLNTGYLPLPLVRLSKYIPAESTLSEKPRKSAETHPRLEPFSPGQVYNVSKGQQVHVIPATVSDGHVT